MLRRKCAIFLSMLLALYSLFPASGYALPLSENSAVETFAEEEEMEKEAPFLQKERVDGIMVTVTADSGVFPENSTLKVKKLSRKAEKQKVETAVEEKLDEDADLAESIIFDISILGANGEEIQPDISKGDVKVQFEQLDFLVEDNDKELAVYHMIAPEAEAEKLEDIQIDKENGSLELLAKHFSLFVISVIEKKSGQTTSAGIEVGSSKSAEEVFKETWERGYNFLYDATEVKSDNEDVVLVEKKGNEYFFTAKKIGIAKIEVKDSSGTSKYLELIVQEAPKSGRIGKNMDYVITGTGNDMTITIRGYGDSEWRERVPWLAYKDNISKVVIQEGVEGFHVMNAFADMKYLRSVTLPSSLTYIPRCAFTASNNLGDITIPASVKEVDVGAFEKTGGEKNKIINLSSFKLKNQNEALEWNKHYDSRYTTVVQSQEANSDNIIDFQFKSLQLYTLPVEKAYLELKSTITRRDFGFSSYDVDYYLYRTDSATEQVDESTFIGTDGELKEEYLLNRNKSMFDLPSDGQNILEEIVYDDHFDIGEWESNKSYYCYILADIKEDAKGQNRKVSDKYTIRLEDAVPLAGNEGGISWSMTSGVSGAFKPPYTLKIEGNGVILDSDYINGDRPWIRLLKSMRNPAINLNLQEGITRIGEDAFSNVHIAGDLVFPNSLREIGSNAFSRATIEGEIQFPNELKSIQNSAFDGINYTGDITLNSKLEEIGYRAFFGRPDSPVRAFSNGGGLVRWIPNSSIGTITIPSSVQYIGIDAFYKQMMGINGKNKIINHSSIKLSERYVNPLYTEFVLDDSGEESIQKPRRNGGSGSYSGGSGSSGGGGSSSGGSIFKPTNSGANSSSEKIAWQKDSKGWWVKNDDGSYPKDEWKKINNNWYFFNKEGYMSTGWVQIKDAWYYLDNTDTENGGKMNTGWKYIGEQWYYFGTEEGEMQGKMSTGWKYISGKWYYLNPEAGANNGKMLFNTVVDGYTLGPDGAWDNQPKKAG